LDFSSSSRSICFDRRNATPLNPWLSDDPKTSCQNFSFLEFTTTTHFTIQLIKSSSKKACQSQPRWGVKPISGRKRNTKLRGRRRRRRRRNSSKKRGEHFLLAAFAYVDALLACLNQLVAGVATYTAKLIA
jgi:hypothetical protein